MAYLDIFLTFGILALVWLIALFIHDDNETPDQYESVTPGVTSSCDDDLDLDFTWSRGVGDHR